MCITYTRYFTEYRSPPTCVSDSHIPDTSLNIEGYTNLCVSHSPVYLSGCCLSAGVAYLFQDLSELAKEEMDATEEYSSEPDIHIGKFSCKHGVLRKSLCAHF